MSFSLPNKPAILGRVILLVFACSFTSAFAKSDSEIVVPAKQFKTAEKYELLPGGATSHKKSLNRNAFSHPSANMSFAKEMDFKLGNSFFKRLWVSAPASTQAADGLGPLFNARSCQRCHIKDGRGHPPEGPDDSSVSMFLRVSIPPQTKQQEEAIAQGRLAVVPEPTYGTQLQDLAIQGHPAEAKMVIEYEALELKLGDGEIIFLRRPTYSVKDLGYGPLHPDAMLSPRVAPPMIGLGLLDAIDPQDILKQQDVDDVNGDGISGKARMVWSVEHKKLMLGRFGWKAGSPSVNEQSQSAFLGDLGLSGPQNREHWGDCTAKQDKCIEAPHGDSEQYEGLEVPSDMMELTVFYARNLSVPARRNVSNPEVLAGKALFYRSGCIDCHTPKYITQIRDDMPEQSRQLIWPYTDLLLHDMGEGLADNRPEGQASGREWRTPPLWGVGLTPVVNGHNYYLHDGRARSLLEAILWHGGEAEASKQQVMAMEKVERERLIKFVESL